MVIKKARPLSRGGPWGGRNDLTQAGIDSSISSVSTNFTAKQAINVSPAPDTSLISTSGTG